MSRGFDHSVTLARFEVAVNCDPAKITFADNADSDKLGK